MQGASISRDALVSPAGRLAQRAVDVLPRGVSSSARIRTSPLILERAEGAHVVDVDGRRYVDYVLGMGPMLLGHGHPAVTDAVRRQLELGVLFGTHPREIELAERIVGLLPFADKVLFANSGSEATHLAIRVARVTTGRRVVVKFEGHYHGWLDPLFVNTQVTPPAPASMRHPAVVTAAADTPPPSDIVVCRWNDPAELSAVFAEYGSEIAAVVMEPLPMNFGTMWPDAGYLEAVRSMCAAEGALLIFDEVLSGFRVALGGASQLTGVRPDISVYAKAVASGFPLALVVGSNNAMSSITDGTLLPAGTYSAGPVGIAAAHATLDVLETEGSSLYPGLDQLGTRVRDGVTAIAHDLGVPLLSNQIGSVIQLFWTRTGPVRTFADAMTSDRDVIAAISEGALEYGSLVSPRGLIMLSGQHTPERIEQLLVGLRASTSGWLDARSTAGADR